MTLTELRYIVAVARERHFGHAADACFVSQPTLSVAVRKLEEELGVQISRRGTIETDPFLRTNFPNILCAGDVAGPYQFTHTAAHQAWYAAVNALPTHSKRPFHFSAAYAAVNLSLISFEISPSFSAAYAAVNHA